MTSRFSLVYGIVVFPVAIGLPTVVCSNLASAVNLWLQECSTKIENEQALLAGVIVGVAAVVTAVTGTACYKKYRRRVRERCGYPTDDDADGAPASTSSNYRESAV